MSLCTKWYKFCLSVFCFNGIAYHGFELQMSQFSVQLGPQRVLCDHDDAAVGDELLDESGRVSGVGDARVLPPVELDADVLEGPVEPVGFAAVELLVEFSQIAPSVEADWLANLLPFALVCEADIQVPVRPTK